MNLQLYDIAENARSFMPAATPVKIVKTFERMSNNLF
jgi:hypothetical protein